MSDGVIVKGTLNRNRSAGSASFWRELFTGSQGIRAGWRLAIFLLIFAE